MLHCAAMLVLRCEKTAAQASVCTLVSRSAAMDVR